MCQNLNNYPKPSKQQEYQFTWHWCKTCDCAYVECPKCGNNSCNAGYGRMDENKNPISLWPNGLNYKKNYNDYPFCDICPLAYQFQDAMYDAGKEPKKESFPIEETTGLGDERMLLEVPIKMDENTKSVVRQLKSMPGPKTEIRKDITDEELIQAIENGGKRTREYLKTLDKPCSDV